MPELSSLQQLEQNKTDSEKIAGVILGCGRFIDLNPQNIFGQNEESPCSKISLMEYTG